MSSTVIPALRYADAPAAIRFLVEAFGFTAHLVVEGDAGTIEHAQLTHGTGMVMLGSDRNENAYGEHVSASGTRSVGLYVVVADVAAHARILHVRAHIMQLIVLSCMSFRLALVDGRVVVL